MNVSEFERNKPKETLKSIRNFEELLAHLWEQGEDNISIEIASDHLREIKERFLAGK